MFRPPKASSLGALLIAVMVACGGSAVDDATGATAPIGEAAPAGSAAPTEPSTEPSVGSSVTGAAAAEDQGTGADGGVGAAADPTGEPDAPTTTVGPPTSAAPSSGAPGEAVTTETTSVPFDGALDGSPADAEQVVRLRFRSLVGDVTDADLAAEALAILNDPRGWGRAGFRFVADDASPFEVVLAEGVDVDGLCFPLQTYGTVSCQNGPVVALNATRWREAVDHWDSTVATYRGYLVNHEVGHLLGQRHPAPRCPVAGRPAGVMEQQTAGLEGCVGNPWPRDWEIQLAAQRPVVYAPWPDWGPEPGPVNGETP